MLFLWVTAAFGHGGPPNTEDLLWDDSGSMLVVSTHGLIYEDGDWDWVCEELFGESLPTDVVRTTNTTWVAGTDGLAHSNDGCTWTWHPQFDGVLIWDLAIDPDSGNRMWLVSDEGLWRSDNEGETFTLSPLPAPEAWLRSVVPMPDDQRMVFGFLDGQAMAWQAGRSTPLDVRSGQLRGLGADESGNVYGRFPRPGGTDELLRIDPDMNAVSILETEHRITAFLAKGDGLMVSVQNEGTHVSDDHGNTWVWEAEDVYACLIDKDDYIWACPREESEHMWVRTETPLLESPKQWENGPRFSDVSGTRCGDEWPVCEDLWPTVALELGVDPLAEFQEEDAVVEPKTGGCGSKAALVFFPWWLLGRRRA